MTDKELQKLSRRDLLELLIEQGEELEATKSMLEEAKNELKSRDISICEAGSIAEAALQLNNVFETAEIAASQYLENVKKASKKQELMCQNLEEASKEAAKKMLVETEIKCQKIEAETKAKCAEMIEKSKQEAKKYWNEISVKLEKYYTTHTANNEKADKTPLNTSGQE